MDEVRLMGIATETFELVGWIKKKCGVYDPKVPIYFTFSDGTMVVAKFAKYWTFAKVKDGHAIVEIKPKAEVSEYGASVTGVVSDVVILRGYLEWVTVGHAMIEASPAGASADPKKK